MLKQTLIFILIFISNLVISQTSTSENYNFSFQMLRELNLGSIQNITFSPFSIQQAIGMTYDGASGQTKDEINKTMYFNNNNKMGPVYKNLKPALVKSTDNVSVSIVNGIWAQNDFTFNADYFNHVVDCFDATLNYTDYRQQKTRDKTARQINNWVDNKTHGHIDQLVQPTDFTKNTRLVLVNAIWLKANWEKPFRPENTRKAPFYNYNQSESTIELMSQTNRFNYYANDSLQIAELQYKGEDLSMLIILPKDNQAFEVCLKNIDSDYLQQLSAKMQMEQLKLYLPKFEVEAKADLKETLVKMGMKMAFTDSADFSGITGKTDLKIDKVIHKALIEVNETGTEAAAATAVIMVTKTAIIKKTELKADKPFIFLVKHNITGQILFIGQYVQGQ